MTETATRSTISLKGSAQMVSEFFYFGISNILYQRGIYPSQFFSRSTKYGLSIQLPSEEKLKRFIDPLIEQMKHWLDERSLKRLVVVIADIKTKETLERWQFDIETDEKVLKDANATVEKSEKKIRSEIGDVIRQITASVTFLPILETACSFDVLIYTNKDTDEPVGWSQCGPKLIDNATSVDLRQFSTGVHAVSTKVNYKLTDDL